MKVSWKVYKTKNIRRIWNPIWEREGFFCLSKQIFHFRLEREVSKRFAKSKRIPSYFLLWHKSLNLQTYKISQFMKKLFWMDQSSLSNFFLMRLENLERISIWLRRFKLNWFLTHFIYNSSLLRWTDLEFKLNF